MIRKALYSLVGVLALVGTLTAGAPAAQAGITDEGSLGVGGGILLGGTTKPATGADPGFVFGIAPKVDYFVIDNLAVTAQFGFESVLYKFIVGSFTTHYIKLLVGVDYHFELMEKLSIFPTVAVGLSVGATSGATKVGAMVDVGAGVQYEIIDNLGLRGAFLIGLPNLGHGGTTFARFGFMFGAFWHFDT